MADSIVIKGISQGVLATIPEPRAWEEVCSELLYLIDQRSAFFRGAQLVLEVGGRALENNGVEALIGALEQREVALIALLTSHDSTIAAAESAGLVTSLDQVKSPTPATRPADDDLPEIDSEE